jgi:hypothetical protein
MELSGRMARFSRKVGGGKVAMVVVGGHGLWGRVDGAGGFGSGRLGEWQEVGRIC